MQRRIPQQPIIIMPSTRSRAYCFTVQVANVLATYDEQVGKLLDDATYSIFQLERAPTTGKLHLQGYVYYKNARTFAAVKKLCPSAHLEVAKGTAQENKDYCSKRDTKVTGPWEVGTLPKPGKRTDIESAVSMIQAGSSLKEVASENPVTYVRYYRGFTALKSILTPERNWLSEGFIYWGPPGSGKSSHVRELAPDAFYLTKSMVSSSIVWFDGYDGQEDIVLDDFYGWVPLTFFLNMIDRYPMKVQTKGGSIPFRAKRVFITSNANPTTWYRTATNSEASALAAFSRRLKEHSNVFFVGYGPAMDQETCPCQDPTNCPFTHADPALHSSDQDGIWEDLMKNAARPPFKKRKL